MNYKKIIVLIVCLSSTVATQAMGTRFFQAVKMCGEIVPLVVAAKISLEEVKKTEQQKQRISSEYNSLLEDQSINKIVLNNGKRVPLVQVKNSFISQDTTAGCLAYKEFPIVYLGKTIINANNFEEDPTFFDVLFFHKKQGTKIEGCSGTYQQKFYESILNHELSHISHSDNDWTDSKKQEMPFIPAVTYCGLRLFKISFLKSIGGACLSLMAGAAKYLLDINAMEKRCDLEGCQTSEHALVTADFFNTIEEDYKDKLKNGYKLTGLRCFPLSCIKKAQILSEEELVCLECEMIFQEAQLTDVSDNILLKTINNFIMSSNLASAVFTGHPHPRVRSQYLKEHAKKLKEEGK